MFNRSEGIAVVFISLVFTAGIFSALAATSGSSHMKELFMFNSGADVVVDVKSGLENVTLDLIDDILQIDGVVQASGMVRTLARVTFMWNYNGYLYPFNRSLTIFGIQPTEWADSVFLRPYFTYYNDPSVSIKSLENSDNVITNFKPVIGYTSDAFGNSYSIMSDNVGVEFDGPEQKYSMNCTIADVMANRPDGFNRGNYGYEGFHANTYLPGEDLDAIFVMMDIDHVYQFLNISYVDKFYIKIAPDANYQQVIEDVGKIAPSSFSDIQSPYSDIDAVLESRAGQAIYGAYTLNVIFSILYLTAGVILVATMKVRSMRKHYSLLRALGTQPPAIVRVVLIDATIGVALGAIVGGTVGTILTYIVLQLPLTYLGLSTAVSWDRLPLLIAIPIPLIIGIVALAIIFSLTTTYAIIRRGLQSNIAEDIQHAE